MKMKALAVAVAALACGTQAFAAEVYNSDGTSLSIGGHVSVGVGEYYDEDVKVDQVSPRINVAGKKDIGNGMTVDAKGEWALNYLNGGGSSFSTRLGYIGLTHEQLGRLVAGTQWTPYYDVGGVADLPIAFANDFLYGSGYYELGSARGEKMVSYRKGFQFGEGFAFNLGLAWQGENDNTSESIEENETTGALEFVTSGSKYDDRGQISVSTELAGFGLGYAYSGGDVTTGSSTENAESHIFSLKYGSYGSGLYAAVVYGMNEYFYKGMEDTSQLEGIVAYGVNDWTFSVNYESVEDDELDETQFSQMALQAEYAVAPSFYTFAGYQIDLGNDINKEENDNWTIGARYYF
ncbi:porin [Vibrio natriegens]|uniref:porin n=1 Tax=Vibrio natriegens TaxID=691 RepID=UPI002284C758|nr:porin [Vibrio natriegens]MCY9879237.1 porin [Vibrio natriegens]